MQIKDFIKNGYNFVNEVKGCQGEGRKCGGRGFEMREHNHICIRGVGSPWDEVLIGKKGVWRSILLSSNEFVMAKEVFGGGKAV